MLQYSVDSVFHALSDPTRRAMIERLAAGPASVSELGEPFEVSLSAIGQHLRVLEESGVVRSHKEGRVRTVELAPEALKTAEDWFSNHRKLWERRLDRMEALLLDEVRPRRSRKGKQ